LADSEEGEQNRFTLSLRRLEEKLAWERIRQIEEEFITLSSRIVATSHYGALVRIESVQGLIPCSEIINDKPIEELIGEELLLKFIEVNENSNRLVLSHKQALEYELTMSKRKRYFVGIKEYQSDVIKKVTELGLEYIDENGNSKFIDFKICSQNSGELLKNPQYVAARNSIGEPWGTDTYIEFLTQPLTKFVFNRQEDFYKLRSQIEQAGWLTLDLT
jgi:predicted RNA-binding protein with RPS1 domain